MRLSIPLSAALLMLAPLARAQTTFAELDVDIPPAPYNQGPEDEYFVASMAPGDVDNDGDIDLHVLASYVNFLTGQMLDLLTLYRNDGPGPDPGSWAFAATTEVLHNAGGITGDMAWGDYDSDGDLDVVVASFEATQLYRNDGGGLVLTDVALPLYDESGQFTPAPLDRRAITWADYDNDGDPDLLIPSVFRHATDYGNTVLLLHAGAG
ncbi:MAG TPA: VCBS repeat-containing protein, partial [Acidimicrobiales bacterium]|nr:VCBS repeat-containing protein [Acidimicrobiales bacterium]